MPNNDPPFVRLANRLTRGMVADIGNSGWSISGFDVKPFPKDDEVAARFVRRELRDGKLEPCGKAEHEEVLDTHKAVADAPHQEAALQRAAAEANAGLVESRGVDEDEDDEDDYLADVEERLAAQQEDETDDPEEQVARNSSRAAPKKKSKSKSKSKSKAAAAEE